MGCAGSKKATAAAEPEPVKPEPVEPTSDGMLLGKTEGAEDAKPADDAPASAYPAVTDGDVGVGDAATLQATGEKVSVLKRTTTDILVKKSDGKEQWCDVEDVSKAASAGPQVGDDAIVRYDIEDVGKAEQPSVAPAVAKQEEAAERLQPATKTAAAELAANEKPTERPVTEEPPAEPAGLCGWCSSSTAQ